MAVPSVQSSPAADNRVGDNISPGGFDYNRIDGINGNRNVTPEFITEVEGMAQRLGTQPEYLLAVMSFETGGSFSPAQPNNAGGSATGLIQFMPDTARELGTSTAALARMSSVDQLQYVERYFNNRSDPGDLNTLEGVYTTVLHGSPRPDPNSTLFTSGTRAYAGNANLDTNRDGRITSGEATSFVRNRIHGDAPPPTSTPPSTPPAGSGTPATPPSTSGGGSVTVKSGDTLSQIAEDNGVRLPALLAANPQYRSNPDLIHPGDTVRLPDGAGSGGSVTVKSGDTLSQIAEDKNVRLSALIAANPQIRNPDLIHPGDTVNLPGGRATSPSASPSPAAEPSAPTGGTPPTSPPATGAPPAGDAPAYAPYTVYSTGDRPAFAVSSPDQLQPHHDYQTKVRDGRTLEVRDVVLAHPGQSQTAQAIPSPMAGEVIHAGPLGNAGNAVIVRGQGGELTYLFHLSSTDVRVGQQVQYGQALGNQGSTGHSTGPHVHIEASSATIDRWTNDLLDGRFNGRRG